MITYDATKREINLAKHGLDLADAALVYDAPNKVTVESPRGDEARQLDIALVEVMGVVLVLVYVVRGTTVRAISPPKPKGDFMKPQSKTDWARVKREAKQDAPVAFDPAAEPYDPNDEAAVAAYWAQNKVVRRGAQKAPTKIPTTIRFDADVLAALKSSGRGWQTRVNEAMREWVKAHANHS